MAKPVKIEIVSGCVHHGPDVHVPGDVFECDPAEASRLIEQGTAVKYVNKPKQAPQSNEPTAEQLAEKARAELLAAVAAAATLEELQALIPQEEPDDEIKEAFRVRHEALYEGAQE